jgi:fatty acid desaturase
MPGIIDPAAAGDSHIAAPHDARRVIEPHRPGKRTADRPRRRLPVRAAGRPVTLQAVAFLLLHQALFGLYLGMTFAPNHKGMPHPNGDEDYLRKQVLTSRNVRGGGLTDVALGGLNYQIEHHLFPSMPTPNLRKAQPIVQVYCAEIGVAYEQTSLIASYRQALQHLHQVGAPARAEHAAR